MGLENWITYGAVLGLPLWLVAEEILHRVGPALTGCRARRSKRLTSASPRGLASVQTRAAECAQAFTTKSEVSHGKR